MLLALAYLGVIVIWSTTPLAIVWGASDDWFYAAVSRITLAAILVLPFLFILKQSIPFSFQSAAIKAYVVGAIPVALGMGIMFWVAQTLPSGWIALIFALAPLLTGIFAHFLLPNARLTKTKLLAVSISFYGLWIIFAPNLQLHLESAQLLAMLGGLLSVTFHAIGTVLVKRCGTYLPSLHIVVGSLWVSALFFFLLDPPMLLDLSRWSAMGERAQLAVLYAAVVGSIIGFFLYYYLLKHMDAMKVALIPVITPMFALALGHFFNNEALTMDVIMGAIIVISGLLLFEWQGWRARKALK